MREEGIDFQQCTNAFLKCSNPERLQELADSHTTQDLLKCGQKWLAAFTPFISDKERKHAGCQHRLFFSQVEYCDNLIFQRRAAVDQITERMLDLNRNIGQPKKITMIYTQSDQTVPGQTADRDRRSGPAQSGDGCGSFAFEARAPFVNRIAGSGVFVVCG